MHVATKLNRTHLVAGRESLLLPCLGRSERDVQATGPQFVSVEDSMSVVHRSQGRLEPASPALRSEVAIVAGVAQAALAERSLVPWLALAADYDRVRERIERVVPGFDDYNRRVRAAQRLRAAERRAHAPLRDAGRARALPRAPAARRRAAARTLPADHAAQPRSVQHHHLRHDDRHRGLTGDRRVVLLHPDDLRALGFAEGARVDITSHFRGETRRVRGFRALAYEVPRGCAAAYFPEANALVPLDSYAEGSRTPSFKSLEISISPSERAGSFL